MVKKNLKLNKQTISDLSREELSNIKAAEKACWENLWTVYYCDVIYTGSQQTTAALPTD
ncbi:MAG: hypothetical protein MUF15_03260 [Acidobacteria bacterium]|jgi:hypothetical protein|nr:hypothetical protein [Acidobacteriota bacterium]